MSHRLVDDRDAVAVLAEQVAERTGIPASHIEKDFWVTEVLRGAAAMATASNLEIVFKGGTSLSKAFGLIERFSEDVDLLGVIPGSLGTGAAGLAGAGSSFPPPRSVSEARPANWRQAAVRPDRNFSRQPPIAAETDATLVRGLGSGTLEDLVRTNSAPYDVGLTMDDLGCVLERGPTIWGPGHLEDARRTLDTFHAQAVAEPAAAL